MNPTQKICTTIIEAGPATWLGIILLFIILVIASVILLELRKGNKLRAQEVTAAQQEAYGIGTPDVDELLIPGQGVPPDGSSDPTRVAPFPKK